MQTLKVKPASHAITTKTGPKPQKNRCREMQSYIPAWLFFLPSMKEPPLSLPPLPISKRQWVNGLCVLWTFRSRKAPCGLEWKWQTLLCPIPPPFICSTLFHVPAFGFIPSDLADLTPMPWKVCIASCVQALGQGKFMGGAEDFPEENPYKQLFGKKARLRFTFVVLSWESRETPSAVRAAFAGWAYYISCCTWQRV